MLFLLLGYNVVEVNASDDRSLSTFKVQLKAATQMSSVLKNDSRPNCLVLDEIDGAPIVSIAQNSYNTLGADKSPLRERRESNLSI